MMVRLAIICLTCLLYLNGIDCWVNMDIADEDMANPNPKFTYGKDDCEPEPEVKTVTEDDCKSVASPKTVNVIPQRARVRLIRRKKIKGKQKVEKHNLPATECTEIINMEPKTTHIIETITVPWDEPDPTPPPPPRPPVPIPDDFGGEGFGTFRSLNEKPICESELDDDDDDYDDKKGLFDNKGGKTGKHGKQGQNGKNGMGQQGQKGQNGMGTPGHAGKGGKSGHMGTQRPRFKTVTRKRIYIQKRRKIRRKISKPVLVITRRIVKEKQTFERIVPKIIETREVIDKPKIIFSIQEGPKEALDSNDLDECVDEYEDDVARRVPPRRTGPPKQYNPYNPPPFQRQPPPQFMPPQPPPQSPIQMALEGPAMVGDEDGPVRPFRGAPQMRSLNTQTPCPPGGGGGGLHAVSGQTAYGTPVLKFRQG